MGTRFKAVGIVTPVLLLLLTLPSLADKKAIYIKPFGIVQGIPLTDPVGNHIKDYISEKIIEQGTFFITSDDEVKQVIAQEELKMSLDACYDDACIKKLMENIKTDYIVYGTVSNVDGLFYITAKILDRSTGRIELARVKTVKFRERDYLEEVSKLMGSFLITGDASGIARFEAEEKEREYAWRAGEGKSGVVAGRRKNIESRTSLLRVGYCRTAIVSSTLEKGMAIESMPPEDAYMIVIDWFPATFRSPLGNGFDLMLRISHRTYGNGTNLTNKKMVLEDKLFPALEDYSLVATGGFLGGRFIGGYYRLGILWQGYAGAAFQYQNFVETATPPKGPGVKSYEFSKNTYGVVGFAGIEIAFAPNFAVFVEGSRGYHPIGYAKVNVEGFSYSGGVTLRTSFL
ncbi:MAG: hypothetical protein EPN93_02585 [Spirochaetes bacterium]|nr:MAG: hypothetical protein EPN93_02585 [Spirochaetota bacterium]